MTNIQKAEENLKKIDSLIVLAQISRNKKLMLMTLEEIEKTIKNCISSILHYEYLIKRAKLSKNPEENFKTFEEKLSKNYISKQELTIIKEILNLTKNHKKSPMEFFRQEEIIIMSENQDFVKLSFQKLTNFISITKIILNKTKDKLKR